MTPKEKAKELYWKFFEAQAKENEDYVADGETAIKCALIAVDEIIKELQDEDTWFSWKYWQEVKQEIEAL